MALRIEITRNHHGGFDMREGDLDGAVLAYHSEKKELLDMISDLMDGLEAKRK